MIDEIYEKQSEEMIFDKTQNKSDTDGLNCVKLFLNVNPCIILASSFDILFH